MPCGRLGFRMRNALRDPTTEKLVADPMRRAILRRIWDAELPVGALVASFDVSQPAISYHLRMLREGGLVRVRAQGNQRYYRAVPEALGEQRSFLESHWQDRPSRLKDEAALQARREHRDARLLRDRPRD